jgi:hypothetical protein
MAPVQVLRRNGQSELWKTSQQRAESETTLHARQRGAEAVMDAVAEGQMTGCGSVYVE